MNVTQTVVIVAGIGSGGGGPVVPVFESFWDTTKTSGGSSDATSIKIPTVSGGTYDCVVDWGDGTLSTITTWNDAAWTHDYGSGNGGLKTIRIAGTFIGLAFVNEGDKLKIISIASWGPFRLLDGSGVFDGCVNLITFPPDLNMTGNTTLSYCLRACSKLVADISQWDVSSVTVAVVFGAGANLITSDLSDWNTGNLSNASYMFYGMSGLNFSLSAWNLDNATVRSEMLTLTGFSTNNYSNALIAWAARPVIPPNVEFGAGTIKYNSSAAAARAILTNSPNNWTITDGGPE